MRANLPVTSLITLLCLDNYKKMVEKVKFEDLFEELKIRVLEIEEHNLNKKRKINIHEILSDILMEEIKKREYE